MEQNRILDIIINLLHGTKTQNKLIEKQNGEELILNGCSYLLNQTIRQYQLPASHYCVSKEALDLWNRISTDSIFNYTYRDTVIKDINGEVCIEKFRGGEGIPYETSDISVGDKFIYKDVFTDEHIVTVSNIIEELLSLSEYDYESIKNVLDKIYICKMLKREDRAIESKKKRSLDYREVIATDYKKAGIEIATFEEEPEFSPPEPDATEDDFLFEVIHDKKGEGKALSVFQRGEDYYIKIAFEDVIEEFVYPDQFICHLTAKDPEIQKEIKSEYAAMRDKTNSKKNQFHLENGYWAGVNAQYIYDKYCRIFGWDSACRRYFARRKTLYAINATPEGFSVWMPVHTDLCEAYNKGHAWFNFVYGDTIKEVWFYEDKYLLNDNSIRVCFAKTQRGYEFQGLYKPVKVQKEEIHGKLEIVRTFQRIATAYPLEKQTLIKERVCRSNYCN